MYKYIYVHVEPTGDRWKVVRATNMATKQGTEKERTECGMGRKTSAAPVQSYAPETEAKGKPDHTRTRSRSRSPSRSRSQGPNQT